MGQCLEMTKEVVKTDKSFKQLEADDDVKGLLGLLRDLCYGTDKKRYFRWIQQAQLRRAVTMTQQPTESIQRFATNFLEQIKTVEAYVQAFTDTNPRNSNQARTLDCIYLRPGPKPQNGHDLLDLTTGNKINW